EPAEVAELRDGDVLPELEPELLGVERERLVLVMNPHRHVGELLQHRVLLRRYGSEATLDPAHAAVFSKRAVSGRAHAMRTHVGTRARVIAGGWAARYWVGVMPNSRPKLVVN